ncbi:MAG TPA: CHAT domain-containing protein, partial [Thioploca sp.]|nr:CHAT domain-containing protein [Thioploca sp.]
MSNLFILDIETHPTENKATLRLRDARGEHIAAHQLHISGDHAFEWVGLFNTREHVERYADNLLPDKQTQLSADELIAQLGVFLGREVLGEAIFSQLYAGIQQRTLLIGLPDTEEDRLAAAFARVPWEIARPSLDKPPLLADHAFAVRAITGAQLPQDREIPLALARNETLRVLLIFADADESRPLAVRLERERLLTLFFEDILPTRLVQIDSLCYGVTRDTIAAQVRKAKGYHIVHWSGHGNHDSLVLLGADGKADILHGAELVTLFNKAGGFVPSLVFLSACHSGAFVSAADWAQWKAKINLGLQETKDLPESIATQQGYTSTALALLRAGVPQVVAMRYTVEDSYARQLAVRFYRYLLGEQHSADAALAMARGQLAAEAHIGAIVHTTPLL